MQGLVMQNRNYKKIMYMGSSLMSNVIMAMRNIGFYPVRRKRNSFPSIFSKVVNINLKMFHRNQPNKRTVIYVGPLEKLICV